MPPTSTTSPTSAGSLFQQFLDGRARTRAELVEATGLGRATVASRVDQLLGAGFLTPAGAATSTGGRPPAMVQFNRSARVVVAIDFGARHAKLAVTDLLGEPISHRSIDLSVALGPERTLTAALDEVEQLLAQLGRTHQDVIGIGVGVPGPVEHSTGRPVNPPIMPGWDRFDIPAYVRQRVHTLVLVDNDVNLLALGEHAADPSATDLVFVKVATGIGAGVISGGALQRGANGSAGDLGHVRVPPTESILRGTFDDRDLEEIASGTAIATALRERGIPARTTDDVVALLQAGDATTLELTREAGRVLGEVLAVVVNLLNPRVLALGGSIARAGEQLLAGVREVVYGRSIPLATQHLSIVQSQAGITAGARGAAIMVLQVALNAAAIDKTVATTPLLS